MPQPNELSRSLVALDQNSTIIAVVELSQSSWLVGCVLPGIERQPCKKLEPSPERHYQLKQGWYFLPSVARRFRCREVLSTPIGLPPLKREGPRRSTRPS
jgi:hypothetical protein